MIKKIALMLTFAVLLAISTGKVLADDTQVVCPQPYGGGVVCGVETHVPVNTGIGDNLPLVGIGLILSSGVVYFLSKKFRISA